MFVFQKRKKTEAHLSKKEIFSFNPACLVYLSLIDTHPITAVFFIRLDANFMRQGTVFRSNAQFNFSAELNSKRVTLSFSSVKIYSSLKYGNWSWLASLPQNKVIKNHFSILFQLGSGIKNQKTFYTRTIDADLYHFLSAAT